MCCGTLAREGKKGFLCTNGAKSGTSGNLGAACGGLGRDFLGADELGDDLDFLGADELGTVRGLAGISTPRNIDLEGLTALKYSGISATPLLLRERGKP